MAAVLLKVYLVCNLGSKYHLSRLSHFGFDKILLASSKIPQKFFTVSICLTVLPQNEF